MKKENAIQDYKELAYDLAKTTSKLRYIRDRIDYINHSMEWDGMFEINFDSALKELAEVESALITYIFEDDFRERDIEQSYNEAKALENTDV